MSLVTRCPLCATAFRVQPAGDPVGDHVVRVLDDAGGVGVVGGQRMPVGDEVETIVLVLERGPVLQRSHEMPEVQFAGRAHT